jgi:hypothetical protein
VEGRKRNAYTVLVGKPARKILFRRLVCTDEHNIKMDLKDTVLVGKPARKILFRWILKMYGEGRVLDLSGFGQAERGIIVDMVMKRQDLQNAGNLSTS